MDKDKEIESLRNTNKELHRRVQRAESKSWQNGGCIRDRMKSIVDEAYRNGTRLSMNEFIMKRYRESILDSRNIDKITVPLQWEGNSANTPFGLYTINDYSCEDESEEWQFTFHEYPYGIVNENKFDNEQACKDAAFEHFKQNLKKCLKGIK